MIPIAAPWIGPEELANLEECLASGWISSAGKVVRDFETAWASYCGVAHGVAMASGTASLDAAVACLDLGPGDEVVLPSFTIISCATAVLRHGGKPVLVDSDPDIWTIDVSGIEKKLTPKTRAIIAVHIYGHPCDMDPIRGLARERGLVVIEDAAEAHGAEYKGRRCGALGDIGCFSFYANKIVATGEGGMAVTGDPRLAARMRSYGNLCFGAKERYRHTGLGQNFRMTSLQAAVGLAQVARIERMIERKACIARRYDELLERVPGVIRPVTRSWAKNVHWLYAILLDESCGVGAAEAAARLEAGGIETRPFFLGMHEQKPLLDRGLFRGESYPVSERLSRRGLCLPSGATLSDEQVDEVVGRLREALTAGAVPA